MVPRVARVNLGNGGTGQAVGISAGRSDGGPGGNTGGTGDQFHRVRRGREPVRGRQKAESSLRDIARRVITQKALVPLMFGWSTYRAF